jgi:MFS family permease|tara:strand:+ start:1449 stop:2735 length:1287 start_codon:yes stop_codon:yes gene_type:complete
VNLLDTNKNNSPPDKPWAAFHFRDYRILWTSSVTAMLTMNLRIIATGIWLYEETGAGSTLAWLGLVEFIMRIPANLYGGALADEVDRKKIMVASQFASFALIGIMAVLLSMDSLMIWHVFVVTAFLSATSVMSNPSRSALTANIVPKSYLVHAVATNTITMQVGTIAMPLVFWITSLTATLTLTFAIASLCGLVSTIVPLFIHTPGMAKNVSRGSSRVKNIIAGLKYVKSHPILPGLYLLDICVTVVSFYRQLFPIFADQLYKGGRGTVSILTAANSFGGVMGSALVMFTSQFKAKGMLVLYATLVYSILLIAFGAIQSLWIGSLIIVALGATDSIGMTTRQTVVQLTTPDNMRGRAVSAHSLAAMTANGIGQAEVGFMSDVIGASNTMLLGGAISLIATLLIWWLIKGIRLYRYEATLENDHTNFEI